MLATLIIVFREVIEAGLIVGIVLAVTQGLAGRNLLIAGSVGAGLIGAGIVAVFAGVLSELFEGNGQEPARRILTFAQATHSQRTAIAPPASCRRPSRQS